MKNIMMEKEKPKFDSSKDARLKKSLIGSIQQDVLKFKKKSRKAVSSNSLSSLNSSILSQELKQSELKPKSEFFDE